MNDAPAWLRPLAAQMKPKTSPTDAGPDHGHYDVWLASSGRGYRDVTSNVACRYDLA